MNTPVPDTPPVQKPDPTTPGPTTSPTALSAALTSAAIGAPPAALLVWIYDTYWNVRGHHMDPAIAALAAGWTSSLITYLFQCGRGILSVLIERWTRP